jgi:hypothetical protein
MLTQVEFCYLSPGVLVISVSPFTPTLHVSTRRVTHLPRHWPLKSPPVAWRAWRMGYKCHPIPCRLFRHFTPVSLSQPLTLVSVLVLRCPSHRLRCTVVPHPETNLRHTDIYNQSKDRPLNYPTSGELRHKAQTPGHLALHTTVSPFTSLTPCITTIKYTRIAQTIHI